jgi:GNAT superfamily N-acetyltransferase
MIKRLNKTELINAIPLVWKVFCEYEACNYPESGKQAFWEAIHAQEYLDMLEAYGYYEGEELLGIMATRNEGGHVALFFVDGAHHRKGIGRSLFEAVLADGQAKTITVHSSLYAVEVYKKLGFVQTDEMQEEGGIQYVPMVYQVNGSPKENIHRNEE